jgi:hypothetical protein
MTETQNQPLHLKWHGNLPFIVIFLPSLTIKGKSVSRNGPPLRVTFQSYRLLQYISQKSGSNQRDLKVWTALMVYSSLESLSISNLNRTSGTISIHCWIWAAHLGQIVSTTSQFPSSCPPEPASTSSSSPLTPLEDSLGNSLPAITGHLTKNELVVIL